MALKIYDTMKPQGSYPAVEAEDVLMPDGTRLSDLVIPEGSNEALVLLSDRVTKIEQGLAYTEVEVYAQQEVSGFAADSSGANCNSASISEDLSLIVGETYRVLWDDVEFTCVCYGEAASEDGTLTLTGAFLGNAAVAFEVLPDTGEPFAISSGSDGTYFRCAEGDSHAVAVYRVVEKPELPAIESDDDGKILQAVDGLWLALAVSDSAVKAYIDSLFVPLSQEDHDALVADGTVDETKYYLITG